MLGDPNQPFPPMVMGCDFGFLIRPEEPTSDTADALHYMINAERERAERIMKAQLEYEVCLRVAKRARSEWRRRERERTAAFAAWDKAKR